MIVTHTILNHRETYFNVADVFLRAALRADSPAMFNVIQFIHQPQGHWTYFEKCCGSEARSFIDFPYKQHSEWLLNPQPL